MKIVSWLEAVAQKHPEAIVWLIDLEKEDLHGNRLMLDFSGITVHSPVQFLFCWHEIKKHSVFKKRYKIFYLNINNVFITKYLQTLIISLSTKGFPQSETETESFLP